MRKNIFKYIVLVLLVVCATANCSIAQIVAPAIFPTPEECEISSIEYVPLSKVILYTSAEDGQRWAEKHLKEWYGKDAPKVTLGSDEGCTSFGEEEYELVIDTEGVKIKARTIQALRYALYSVRQIAIADRGTLSVEGWIVPKSKIKDKPKIDFRGIHICWFHETEPWEVERLVRLAAYYKMNYAVIESWGTFRSDVAPWFGWKDGTMTKSAIKRLKVIADDLGITLIPQINVFGHATQARSLAGKHTTLDINPKYQPLFEPLAGWNWCLSNPETRKLLQDLIKERYEAFGCPPFFHIGGDEANPPSCPDCASKPYSELFLDHIEAMNQTITSLGARTMMWHDMLIKWEPRFDGFVTNGTQQTADGFLKFPRDIIVADWYYGGKQPKYPTCDYFQNQGFSVLTCPWNNVSGIISQSKYAHETGLMGVLGTLWHHYYGRSLAMIYYTLSNSMWNPYTNIENNMGEVNLQRVHTHLRHIGWDMKLKNPRRAGTYYDEIPPEPFLNN